MVILFHETARILAGWQGMVVLNPTMPHYVEGNYEAFGRVGVYRARPGKVVITSESDNKAWSVRVPDVGYPRPRLAVVEDLAYGVRIEVMFDEKFAERLLISDTVYYRNRYWHITGLRGRRFVTQLEAEDALHYLSGGDGIEEFDEVTRSFEFPSSQWQHLLRSSDG